MNQKQQAFVCELLRHGNRAEAYRTAYQPKSNNPRSLQSAADRLMQNPEVAEAVQTVQDRIYAEVQEELKAHMLREALTVQRKREILAQIAEGEWMVQPPPENVPGQPTAVLIPTLKERLKAIDMDNKLTGAYQREKATKHNDSQQEPPATQVNQPTVEPTQPARHIRMPFTLPVIDTPDPQLNKPKPGIAAARDVERVIANITTQPPSWLQTIRV